MFPKKATQDQDSSKPRRVGHQVSFFKNFINYDIILEKLYFYIFPIQDELVCVQMSLSAQFALKYIKIPS